MLYSLRDGAAAAEPGLQAVRHSEPRVCALPVRPQVVQPARGKPAARMGARERDRFVDFARVAPQAVGGEPAAEDLSASRLSTLAPLDLLLWGRCCCYLRLLV